MSNDYPKGEFRGVCIAVPDGDGAHVNVQGIVYELRLSGIDAPERGQNHGVVAWSFLSNLISNKIVHGTIFKRGKYGRLIATLYVGNIFVNELLVEAGHAWLYPQYCPTQYKKHWLQLQIRAQSENKGLWAEPQPVAPWVYRKGNRRYPITYKI